MRNNSWTNISVITMQKDALQMVVNTIEWLLLLCVDGLTGFRKAIGASVSNGTHTTLYRTLNTQQYTICKLQVHQGIYGRLKSIYQAYSEKQALN